MLPYKNRLIKRSDFEKVYRYGKFFYFENIVLKIAKNGLNETRIGFSVGIGFSKKATERNRIKRQLREIFHKILGEIKKGIDIVVIVKKERNNKKNSQDEISLTVKKILSKENLIKN